MPVYNCEKYIEECISSILAQTFNDFELLVFNDGSKDNSLEKIQSFNDIRIKVYNSSVNVGYVQLLNQGIVESKGNYIIRMDADDVCYNNRFFELVKFMDENPEIGVCGSYVRVFGNVKDYIWTLPLENESIKAMLPFRIPFIHPSVIIRKKVLTDNSIQYKNDFLPAEDYELWCDLARVTKFANIPLVLLKYRQHQNQISKEKKNIQQNNSDRVRDKYYRKLFPKEEDFMFYQNIVNERIDNSKLFLEKSVILFKSIEDNNTTLKIISMPELHNELSFQLFKIATHISSKNIRTINIFKRSGFSKSTYISKFLFLKYILKNSISIGKK